MKKFAIISLFVFLILILMGNSPAPWWACEGKNEGEPCTAYGTGCSLFRRGVCRRLENCQDDPQTTVNECLWCG